jgi:hypothetical protein
MRWLQMSGALMLLAALLPPRIGVLQPHARRIGVAALVIYLTFAAIVVIARVVLGPEAFMG